MLYKSKADYLQRRFLEFILLITLWLSTQAYAGSDVSVNILCFLCKVQKRVMFPFPHKTERGTPSITPTFLNRICAAQTMGRGIRLASCGHPSSPL